MNAPTRFEQGLAAAVSGLLFGAGLVISGMCNPDKVLNFLDITGSWDPTLAVVMAAALVITVPAFLMRRRHAPDNEVEGNGRIDARLIAGSALFGIGWGIAGFCPGPALANLAGWGHLAAIFVLAMIAGSQIYRIVARR